MSSTGKRKRELPVIGPDEALEILASAVNYCQKSGLRVRAGNADGGRLAIVIDGASVVTDALGLTRFAIASNPDAGNRGVASNVASTPGLLPAQTD